MGRIENYPWLSQYTIRSFNFYTLKNSHVFLKQKVIAGSLNSSATVVSVTVVVGYFVINTEEFHRLDDKENEADEENDILESLPRNPFLYSPSAIGFLLNGFFFLNGIFPGFSDCFFSV
ncbi:hypothetical protein AVEN_243125-1 [Araneus ventricosus]|uniref:Uncharacterized protein n=1 Tax=Araneus ventricosus TaxID=182803 RepID=A0A4Y2NHB8_ARAVE|nr:hypothetical protein AVEN_243125-1 [Araneus ventricosus]